MKLRGLFEVDLRSLLLFRIGLAAVLFADLLLRFRDLAAHYTDQGVLPRLVLFGQVPWERYASIHVLCGTSWCQGALLAAGLGGALWLLTGYRTRWAVFFCWVHLASLHARNPFVLEQGDALLILLLFWSLFLPWEKPRRFSCAGIALILQIVIVYWFGAALKALHGPEWWKDGTAAYYALSFEPLATPFARWLLSFPALLKYFTRAVFLLEIIGPLLLFSPWKTGPVRTAALVALSLMHLAFRVGLHLWPFPWVNLVALLIFLPPWFWDKLGRLSPQRTPAIEGSRWVDGTAALFFLVVLVINGSSLPGSEFGKNSLLRRTADLLHLNQNWQMFAPSLTENGWLEVHGRSADGWERTLVEGRDPATHRWRLYYLHLAFRNEADELFSYGRALCRDWNARLPEKDRLQDLKIWYFSDQGPEGRRLLWKSLCRPDS